MLTTMEEKKAFVQRFNVFDDMFFEVVAKDRAAVEDILRIILHDPALVVEQLLTQDSIKNLYGRSVRLDALCITGDGRSVNVEVQKADDDNHVKRVRYNASCITANVAEPGEHFENISDVYVVYISKSDIFKRKRRTYYVERCFYDEKEMVPVEDGEHIVYVNASNEIEAEDADIAELMEFFKYSHGQNEKFKRLTDRVYELKNDTTEVLIMCKTVEEYMADYIAEEIAKGKRIYMEEAMEKGMEKGIQKGMEEGMQKGMEKGMQKGMEKGREAGVRTAICGLVYDGILSAAVGAERLNVSVPEFYSIMRELGYQDSEPV